MMGAGTTAQPSASHHHPVFDRFKFFRGRVPAGVGIDCLGTQTDSQFVAGMYTHADGTLVETTYPDVNEEYFEWIDLLESVVGAKDSYTMIDLGAGYGRWAVRAAFAVQQFHPGLPFHLIAVEAEPTTFTWLGQHFANNRIDPSRYRLLHGAVSETRGEVLFYIGGPRGGPYDKNPNEWYGQFLTKDYDIAGESEDDGEYQGFKVKKHKTEWRSISVPSVSLGGLLEALGRVDLIDMDIEGQELPSIRATIDALDSQVKRLHIGTHGKEIEDELRQLLSAHNWECLADYSLFSTSDTPWGPVTFENGVQTWVNPRLR